MKIRDSRDRIKFVQRLEEQNGKKIWKKGGKTRCILLPPSPCARNSKVKYILRVTSYYLLQELGL